MNRRRPFFFVASLLASQVGRVRRVQLVASDERRWTSDDEQPPCSVAVRSDLNRNSSIPSSSHVRLVSPVLPARISRRMRRYRRDAVRRRVQPSLSPAVTSCQLSDLPPGHPQASLRPLSTPTHLLNNLHPNMHTPLPRRPTHPLNHSPITTFHISLDIPISPSTGIIRARRAGAGL